MAVAYMATKDIDQSSSTTLEKTVKTMTQPIRFRTIIATLILGALASSLATVYAAEDNSDAPKIVVKYADLNVSHPQGAAALLRRIRRAGEAVCGSFVGGLGPKMRVNACVQNAVADAVTKVNQPQLFAIYKANYKTPSPTTLLSQNR
jgi:UrcA family protein